MAIRRGAFALLKKYVKPGADSITWHRVLFSGPLNYAFGKANANVKHTLQKLSILPL